MTARVLDQRPVAPRGEGGHVPPHEGAGGGDGPPGNGGGILADPARLGLWLFLGTVTMLFVGFTSAYIARRASADWRPLALPVLLWVNTALLLASSVTVEAARRRLRRWEPGVVTWLAVTGTLGALFVAGQVAAWRSLTARGVLLSSNPHNSFFYLLTGLHVVHLLGALVWLLVVLWKARRLAYTPGQDGLGLFATFWHFLGGLWVYLFLLLFVF
jgi:cytochrome c oxidase subunit III